MVTMDHQDLDTTDNASASPHADTASSHEIISIDPVTKSDDSKDQVRVSSKAGQDTAGSVMEPSLFHEQVTPSSRASSNMWPRPIHFDKHQNWLVLKEGSHKNGKPRGAHTPGDTTFEFKEAPNVALPASFPAELISDRRSSKHPPVVSRYEKSLGHLFLSIGFISGFKHAPGAYQ